MSSEELVRSELHERLAGAVGPHGAAYLMARVPPMEWDKLAHKEDIDDVKAAISDVRSSLGAEIAEVRSSLAAESNDIRSSLAAESNDIRGSLGAEIAEVRSSLAAEIKDLRKDTTHEFALVRTEMVALKHEVIGAFRGELTAALAGQARILVVQHVVLFLAFAGFALATR